MSAYEPKHTNPAENPAGVESLWEKLREAGRKVLCSSMSVILAASLVPVMPTAVYAAEEEQQQTQPDGEQQENGQSEEEQQPEQQPEQTPPAESEPPAPEGEPPAPEGNQGEGSTDAGGPGTEGSEGTGNEQEGQQQEEQQQEEAQQEEAQQEEVEQPAGNDGNKSENPSSGPAPSSTSSGGDKGSNGNDSPKNDDQQKKEEEKKDNPDQNKQPDNPPTLTVQAVDAPTLEVGFSGEAPAAGQNYVSRSVVITVRGTQLSADGATASVTYDGAAGPIDAQLTGGGDSLTATVVLGPGTYTGVNASVANVKYGEGGSQTFNSDVRSLGGDAFTVVNPDAPTLKSIKLIKTGGSAEVPLNDGNQYVFAANEVQEIRVQVEDDALNLDDNTSFVEVLNAKGEQIAKQGFAGGDGTYTATISGVTGRIALRVKGASYGAESDQIKFFGGNADAGVADGSLVIDEKAPELTSIKIGEQVVTDDNPIYAPGQSPIVVTVADELLQDDSAVSYACVLNGEGTGATTNIGFVYNADNQCYVAEVPVNQLAAGSYKLKVQAKDKVHDAIVLDHPLVIKTQPPEIQSVRIEGEDVAADGSYAGKQLVITVKDTALDTDGSQVMLTPVNGSETPLEGTWNQDAEAGTYTFTSGDIPEGTYAIKIAVKDKAGMAASGVNEFQNVTIGKTQSTISASFKDGSGGASILFNDGAFIQVNSAEGLIATINVDEDSFDPNRFAITVTKTDARAGEEAFSFTYDPNSWTLNGDVHTYTIAFPDEGEYAIHVEETNEAGQSIQDYDKTFRVDKTVPVVNIVYPSAEANPEFAGYTQGSTHVEAGRDQETDYFDNKMDATVTIADRYLDEAASTVNGITLATLRNGKDKTEGEQTYEAGSIKYVTSYADVGGKDTYTVKATYSDGEYSALTVHAEDKSTRNFDDASNLNDHGGKAKIVVDTVAPVIQAAFINKEPKDLTDLTTGYVNGKDGVYFFSNDNGEATIRLKVEEPHGIRSIELTDGANAYELDTKAAKGALALAQNTPVVFNIIEKLIEERDFSNNVKVILTDFAGNQRVWSMNEDQSLPRMMYDSDKGTKMDPSPVLLIVDGTKPKLVLTESVPASAREEYPRHFKAGINEAISLTVTERNLKYLRGFGGIAGYDPARTVLTVKRTPNKVGAKPEVTNVSVAELIEVDEAAGEYKLDEAFNGMFNTSNDNSHSRDGHYDVSARLTDIANNTSDMETLERFTIDTVAPAINVKYSSAPNIPEDGEKYYQGVVTATVTITEHNFKRSDFQFSVNGVAVEAAWKDKEEDDAKTDVHVCTVTFSEQNDYKFEISGQDLAGNEAVNDENGNVGYQANFHVSLDTPAVEIAYEEDTAKAANPQLGFVDDTKNVLALRKQDTDYFAVEPTVVVVISDRYIDEEKTTLNVTQLSAKKDNILTLATLLNGKLKSGDVQEYVDNGVKFSTTYGVDGNKTQHYTIKVTYPDGEFNNLKVHAQGKGNGKFDEDAVNRILVDTEAPEILKARTTAAPKVNGNDSVYFFTGGGKNKGQAKHAIEFTVKDPHGIRSIELYDPSGRYKLYQSSARSALVKNREAKFQIIDTLVDGEDFSDEVKVTITDFAGNRREWSMADGVLPDLLDTDGREMKHPSLLIEDNTDPVLTLSDIKENNNVDKRYKRFVNEAQSIHLTAAERTLKYLIGYKGFKGLDPTRTVLTVTYAKDKAGAKAQSKVWPGATVTVSNLTDNENDLDYYFDRTFKANGSEDGHYNVTAQLVDVVGNKSKKIVLDEFTIDTKAPEFTVTYTGAKRQKNANGKEYYNGPRTATIKVEEHNWDDSLFSVAIAKSINHAVSTKVKPSAWSHDGDIHTCTVSFSDDGEYQLKVSGKDKAGNEALLKKGSSVTKTKVYDSGVFVVDDEKPVIAQVYDNGAAPAQSADPTVEFPAPTGMYKGKSYYSHAIDVKTRVKDRSFDAKTTKVYRYHNGSEAKQDVTWSQLGSRRDLNGYEVYQASVNYTEDGDYQTPHVKFARDFANNQSENDPRDFVIDLVAPSISVSVDQNPTSTGAGNDQNDPIQFFNVATKMTFSMSDLHLLRSYTLDDPDGQYVIATTTQNVEGQRDATLVIELRDGANVANDTEYQRNITLTVQDLAGNQRMWTIDRTGKVVVDQTNRGDNNPANKSINDADIYPVALIQDTTAPYISLEGPAAGSYSNSTQHVRASVNEFNFEYLQRFDGSRVIMTVTKYEGNAGRAMSTWVVPASNFSGTRPSYGYDQPFEGDGHYSVVAEFLDYANNPSNRATVAEFTVDKTAPTISVTWTSPDGNAPYYRDTRVATITVVEHNFDPSLFAITTTGARSGWSSNGDVHTMTITYANDGTYNLNITGRDRAGNEAVAYNGTQFVIDKTAPKITFGGRVQRYGVEQRDGTKENEYSGDITKDGKMPSPGEAENETLQDHHAYNGVVMPTIEFIDQNGGGQTNYNPSGVHYTITAGKHGRDTDLIDKRTIASATGGEIYQFEDFGLLVQNDSDDKDARNVYDPEADDVYTIKANMEDKAGNKAEGTVTFSVNRYGSNFLVTAYDGNGKPMEASSVNQNDGQDYDLVGEAPVIEVHEINVSGSDSEKDHSVLKEYANAVDPIKAVKHSDKRKDGYELTDYDASGSASKYGWYEYVYTIRSGNFGSGSPSDSGDGGQGVYRVNVASIDRASNDTSSAEYLSTTDYEKASKDSLRKVEGIASSLKNATATFTLDQIAPFIDEFSVPNIIALGTSYTARVHVTDAITKGDTVKVFVDGVDKTAEVDTSGVAMDGTGTYSIEVPANFIPFSMHEVRVEASDGFASHEVAKVASERFLVTILVPEIAVIAAVVGAIVGGVVFYRKRKEVAEPETPGSY